MPFGEGPIAQTDDDWRLGAFHIRLNVSGAPDLNSADRMLLCGLKVARMVERDCQSAIEFDHYRSVILLLLQRVNSFGNPHCRRELVRVEGIAPLTYECHAKEERTVKQTAQGLGALVANSGLG